MSIQRRPRSSLPGRESTTESAAGISARGPDPLRWDVIGEHTRVRVASVGELDLASTDGLRQAIHELRRSGVEHLILDLRRVRFIDPDGRSLQTRTGSRG